ncbi:MAG: SCO family protein [Puniceicoccaceae bacterium]
MLGNKQTLAHWLTAFFTAAIMATALSGESVEGVIRSVDPEALEAVLDTGPSRQGEVAVTISRGDARILQAGDPVRGELVPYGAGQRLQTIWPNDPVARGTIARLGQALRKDTLHRGSKVFRGVGEYMPKFALYDTDGSLFLSESLKGNYVIMNFIFTRCANPNMCPAATARMKELQDMAREDDIKDLRLVSVTLDPEYDTPGIFTAYAADKGLDTATFHLLGGPVQIVEDLKVQMGVLAEPDEEEIVRHTMSTALIDPTGKIIYRIPGSMWSPAAFLKQYMKHRAKE